MMVQCTTCVHIRGVYALLFRFIIFAQGPMQDQYRVNIGKWWARMPRSAWCNAGDQSICSVGYSRKPVYYAKFFCNISFVITDLWRYLGQPAGSSCAGSQYLCSWNQKICVNIPQVLNDHHDHDIIVHAHDAVDNYDMSVVISQAEHQTIHDPVCVWILSLRRWCRPISDFSTIICFVHNNLSVPIKHTLQSSAILTVFFY